MQTAEPAAGQIAGKVAEWAVEPAAEQIAGWAAAGRIAGWAVMRIAVPVAAQIPVLVWY